MEIAEYCKMYELEEKHFWFLGKRLFADSVLAKHLSKIKRVLDVGSGTGGMTKHLQKYGECIGLEKSPLAVGLTKKRGIKVIVGDAEKLPFDKNQFDLVTLFDVLYHKDIEDEKEVIKEIYRVLKPDGFLLVTDSALEFLRSSHDITLGGKRRYTCRSLERIVKSQKFKIIKSSYIYFSIFPLTFFKKVVLEKIIKPQGSDVARLPWIINSFLLLLLKLESALLKYIDFPIGSSVIVLAKK